MKTASRIHCSRRSRKSVLFEFQIGTIIDLEKNVVFQQLPRGPTLEAPTTFPDRSRAAGPKGSSHPGSCSPDRFDQRTPSSTTADSREAQDRPRSRRAQSGCCGASSWQIRNRFRISLACKRIGDCQIPRIGPRAQDISVRSLLP
jgi:hypothetical protein